MSNEWFTPPLYIEAARIVMGGIDLDPASCAQANVTVRATHYYTREQNGLLQPWYGRIWLNPPYGHVSMGGNHLSHQKAFAERLLACYHQGEIEQAILLSLGNLNSNWFQPFLNYPLCIHRGHILFARPDGSLEKFGFPNAFVYLGEHEQRFIENFSRFGRIMRAIDERQPAPVAMSLW